MPVSYTHLDVYKRQKYHNNGYLNQLQYLIYVSDYRLPGDLPYYEIQDGDSTSEVCSAIAEYKLEQVQICLLYTSRCV